MPGQAPDSTGTAHNRKQYEQASMTTTDAAGRDWTTRCCANSTPPARPARAEGDVAVLLGGACADRLVRVTLPVPSSLSPGSTWQPVMVMVMVMGPAKRRARIPA
jgi:hypothetical protein